MFKNYFFLNRLIVEANKALQHSKITSIFSQEKDKLIIETERNHVNRFIEASVNPGFPYLVIKDAFNRAKKNTIKIFETILPAVIFELRIAVSDRVIKICLDKGDIYFIIRGKYTNLILLDKSESIDFFKNMPKDFSEDSFKEEINHTDFISNFNRLELHLPPDKVNFENLQAKYPFLGKEILNEAKVRPNEKESGNIIPSIRKIIKEVETEKPVVISDWKSSQLILSFTSFHTIQGDKSEIFEDVVSALNYFIGKRYYLEDAFERRKNIQKYLDRELGKLSNKLNNLKALIERGTRSDEYQKLGNLLLINMKEIRTGLKEVEVPDIYSDNQLVKIKLDPSLSARKNVDRYFDKAKDDKIKFEKAKELFKNVEAQFKKLKSIEEKFVSANQIGNYLDIMKELKIKEHIQISKPDDLQTKFKHYIIEGKYNLFVGKDSKNNDMLTTKFAKQNDYWFHARGVSGSHAVLRVENNKEAVPKNILKKAAAISAYHSKAKTSSLAPVSYTFKKYVVKKKGMEPGKVAMLKEDVLLVKPEIPAGCEFVSFD